MCTYKEQKENARQRVISFWTDINDINLTWGEIAEIQNKFYQIGKRYGLLREFRENAII